VKSGYIAFSQRDPLCKFRGDLIKTGLTRFQIKKRATFLKAELVANIAY
jgi:hypothetical protein